MEKIILYASGFDIELDSLLKTLHIDEDDDYIENVLAMREQALRIAKPVAFYSPVTPFFDGTKVIINNVVLDEPFVYEKLKDTCTVVPYVASCGVEIDNWAETFTDIFDQFTADTIKQILLTSARSQMFTKVKNDYFNGESYVSTLNPGSLKEWGLHGQLPLFEMLGGVTADIGVKLSDSLLMSPNKTVSGIIFPSETKYENCQLCPRIDCKGRRAAYIH